MSLTEGRLFILCFCSLYTYVRRRARYARISVATESRFYPPSSFVPCVACSASQEACALTHPRALPPNIPDHSTYCVPTPPSPRPLTFRYPFLPSSPISEFYPRIPPPRYCSGKSTLLNLLSGKLEPTSGEVTRHRHLRIGRYDQHFHELLPEGKSPCEFLRTEYDIPEQQARKVC